MDNQFVPVPAAKASAASNHSFSSSYQGTSQANAYAESRPFVVRPNTELNAKSPDLELQRKKMSQLDAGLIRNLSIQPASLPTSPALQKREPEDSETEEESWEGQTMASPVTLMIRLGEPADWEHEVTVHTYRNLVEAYDAISSVMFFDKDDLMPDRDDNPYWEQWQDRENHIDSLVRFYASREQTMVPLNVEIANFRATLRSVRTLGANGHRAYKAKEAELKRQLKRARTRILEARKTAQDAQRMLFLSGEDVDTDAESSSSFLWAMTDHLFTFGGTLADAMELPYNRLHTLIPAAVSLANVVVNWSATSPAMEGTALEGLAALNNVVSLGGAANSLFINPGYIVTSYVGPMLSAITKMLGKLQTQLIEKNDDATAILGSPMYIGAEPGGKSMWNYMVSAMRASSARAVPTPTGSVYDYFDKFSDRFDEFNQAKHQGAMQNYRAGTRGSRRPSDPGEIPTRSTYILFSEVDPERFPRWLYGNRQLVWTSLYGSRDPQRAQPIE